MATVWSAQAAQGGRLARPGLGSVLGSRQTPPAASGRPPLRGPGAGVAGNGLSSRARRAAADPIIDVNRIDVTAPGPRPRGQRIFA